MVQVEIFAGKSMGALKATMNAWLKDQEDMELHVLSMLPIPLREPQGGLALLLLYEIT